MANGKWQIGICQIIVRLVLGIIADLVQCTSTLSVRTNFQHHCWQYTGNRY
jgi:hypothetical protein